MRYSPDRDQIHNNITADLRATTISNQWKIHDTMFFKLPLK